jgi:hypothetical protein
MSAAGYVLAAGGVAAANEVLFLPLEGQGSPAANFNWRLVPATAILALTLTGFERIAPQFGGILGGMVLLAVLIIPVGNAKSPAENLADIVTRKNPAPVKKANTGTQLQSSGTTPGGKV